MESSTENITAEDQAAQAREARRKRILENSSKRLEQITGRNAEEFENEAAQENTIYPDPELDLIWSYGGNTEEPFPEMNLMQSMMGNMSHGGGVQPPRQSTAAPIPENFLVKTIRTKIPIIVISIGMFFLFHMGYSDLVSGNVLLSLLLWEAAEIFLLNHFGKLSTGPKFQLVIALFSLPQSIIQNAITVVFILTKVIQDISVFMFVFILLHYFYGEQIESLV